VQEVLNRKKRYKNGIFQFIYNKYTRENTFFKCFKKKEDTIMIYLILVSILGINLAEEKTELLKAEAVEFATHNNKTIGHNNTIKYTKAPTVWVKLINN
jgi:hypothetical protein